MAVLSVMGALACSDNYGHKASANQLVSPEAPRPTVTTFQGRIAQARELCRAENTRLAQRPRTALWQEKQQSQTQETLEDDNGDTQTKGSD